MQLAPQSISSQKGSALMIALFVIIVVFLLGSSLVKLLESSNESISQEVLGARALAAANSGMQAQLQQLFPLNGAGSVCPMADNYSFDNVQGLNQCRAETSCDNYATVNSVNYFRLTSTGICGTGNMAADSKTIVRSSRTVQVEARTL